MALPDIKYFLGIGENPTEPKIHLSQYDTGNTFRVFLVSHGHFVGIDNDVSAVIVGKKPDGTAYTYNCGIANSRTAVIVTVREEMTAVAGDTEAEIVLTRVNGKRIGTCNFLIHVEKSPVSGGSVSQTDLEAVYQAVTLAADVRQTQTEIKNTQTTLEAMQNALAGMQAELREAITDNAVVAIPLTVTAAAVAVAITQAQETGEPVTLARQYVTADAEDAAVIRAAIGAGKKVRFDLVAKIGGGFVARTSASRYRTYTGGRDITHYVTAFDHADLCGYFTGLSLLKVDYTYDGASGRNSVAVIVEAVQEDLDLIFTAPISDPIVTQTTIPATANHTEEEVTAAYAAGKKVNVKIHFTTGTPIAFDLEPVYTVAMRTDGTTVYMYSGLLTTIDTDPIDAYQVMAMWENGEPIIMIAGKIGDNTEA